MENTDIATLSIYEFTDKEGYTTKFLKDKNGLFDLDGTRITEDKLKKIMLEKFRKLISFNRMESLYPVILK